MSYSVPVCDKCNIKCSCERVGPFAPIEHENVFAVSWLCSNCGFRSLVVSPVGPWLVPKPVDCLQCGRPNVPDGAACPNCGTKLSDVLTAEEIARSNEALLQSARVDFAEGTCRRGLTLVNLVLRRNPASSEACTIKAQFFEHLGYRTAMKAALQQVIQQEESARAVRPWWQFWS
jgi:Alkyl sulfatase dimerisation